MVGEAIRSALAQGARIEVIVIDDGSTDNSWHVISNFSEILAKKIEHSGVSTARNIGLSLAKGEYIKFLDSDDLLPDGSVNVFLDLQMRLSIDQIAFGTATVKSDYPIQKDYGYGSFRQAGALPADILLRDPMPCGLPLFPARALHDAGGFDEAIPIGEDYVLAAKLHSLGYTFIHFPIPAYIVRDHRGLRLSRRYGAKGFSNQLAAFQVAIGILAEISLEERRAIGEALWILGREASRQGYREQASAIFSEAERQGGHEIRVGSRAMNLLYRLLSPYQAERVAEVGKRALRKRQ